MQDFIRFTLILTLCNAIRYLTRCRLEVVCVHIGLSFTVVYFLRLSVFDEIESIAYHAISIMRPFMPSVNIRKLEYTQM